MSVLGFDVLISRFEPFYEMAEYLAEYTDGLIGLAVGLPTVRQVMADEKYYTDLPGGVLESVGRLFKRSVKMYVYPTRDPVTGQIKPLDKVPIPPPWHHLHNFLMEMVIVQVMRSGTASAPVVVVTLMAVALLVTVTVASTMPAPEGSVTVP